MFITINDWNHLIISTQMIIIHLFYKHKINFITFHYFVNNYFFFDGLLNPTPLHVLFGFVLVVVVVVIVVVVVVVVAVVDTFDSSCSRTCKCAFISSWFKPCLYFAGPNIVSELGEGSCSLTSDVDFSESVGEKMKML